MISKILTLAGSAALALLLTSLFQPAGSGLGPAAQAASQSGGVDVLADGSFEMDVPVPVFLLGFDRDVGRQLGEALAPEHIQLAHASYLGTMRADRPDGLTSETGLDYYAMPNTMRVRYEITQWGGDFERDFFEQISDAPMAGGSDIFDGNHAEEILAAQLAQKGKGFEPGLNALVLLHAGDRLPEDHGWRYTMTHGYVEPVRYFGERGAFSVFDVSARPDPYVLGERPVGTRSHLLGLIEPPVPQEYDYPMASGGETTVQLLAKLVEDATDRRMLHAPVYPISTRPCHQFTIIAAVHEHAATQTLPGFARADDWVNGPAVASAWRNLTQDDVRVSVRVLSLPRDDPVLDGLLRATFSAAGFTPRVRTADLLLKYVHANWNTYAVAGEGCEEELAVYYFPDAAQEVVRSFGGLATYDVISQRRLLIGLSTDVSRIRGVYDGPGREVVGTHGPSRTYNWPTANLVHEGGHLFGMSHPDVAQPALATQHDIHFLPLIGSFMSGWSCMGYQNEDRLGDFGAVDQNNFARNRAAYALYRAHALGLEGTSEFDDAVKAIERYEWNGAHVALEGLLETAEGLHSPSPRIP